MIARAPATTVGVGVGLMTGVCIGLGFALLGVATTPIKAMVGVLAAAAGVLLILRPELGLYATALVIPIERLGRLTDDSAGLTISLMRIVGGVSFLIYLLHFLIKRRRPVFPREAVVLTLFTALVGLSIFYTTDPTAASRGFASWVGNLSFFLLVINGVQSRAMASRLVLLMLLSSAAIGAYSLYQWRSPASSLAESAGGGIGQFKEDARFQGVLENEAEFQSLGTRRRLMGPTSHPTVYAANLLMALPLAVFFLMRVPNRLLPRSGWLLVLAIFATSMVLTGTRAAVLVAGILGLLMLAFRLVRLRPIPISIGALVVVVLLLATPRSVTERIFSAESYTVKRSATLRVRLSYWQSGLEIFADNPIFGVGYSNFHELPKRNREAPREGSTLHNGPLQLAVELGAVGFVTFYYFVWLAGSNLQRAFRLFRRRGCWDDAALCAALGLTLVAPILLGLTVDWHQFPLKVWWLATGLALVLRQIAEHDRTERAPEPILPIHQSAQPPGLAAPIG